MNESMLQAAAKAYIRDCVSFLRTQAEAATKQAENATEEKWVNVNNNKANKFASIAAMLEDSIS